MEDKAEDNMSNLETELGHLKRHINYPADKKAIVEACNNMSDVPVEDRNWFSKTIPEGRYTGPEEVLKALLNKV